MEVENDWLDRYLRPERCIHDNGGKFTSIPFIHPPPEHVSVEWN